MDESGLIRIEFAKSIEPIYVNYRYLLMQEDEARRRLQVVGNSQEKQFDKEDDLTDFLEEFNIPVNQELVQKQLA